MSVHQVAHLGNRPFTALIVGALASIAVPLACAGAWMVASPLGVVMMRRGWKLLDAADGGDDAVPQRGQRSLTFTARVRVIESTSSRPCSVPTPELRQPPNGHRREARLHVVDPDVAGLQAVHGPERPVDVLRPDRRSQPVVARVCERDRLVLGLPGQRGEHGPEELLVRQLRARGHAVNDRGLQIGAGARARQRWGCGRRSGCRAPDAVARSTTARHRSRAAGVIMRAHLRGRVRREPDADLRRLRRDLLQHRVRDVAMDHEAATWSRSSGPGRGCSSCPARWRRRPRRCPRPGRPRSGSCRPARR